MAFAASSAVRTAYIAETSYGVTPATPVFKELRVTNGGPRLNKSTTVSDERRKDRNVAGLVQTGQDWAGDYSGELSYGTFDDILEALLFGTWTTNVLKNGTTAKSFTFEETRQIGAGSSFSRYAGAMINSGSFNLQSRSIIAVGFNVMAHLETLDTAIVTGATYTAANTKTILNASGSVASLAVAGITPTPKVRSLSFDINNNLRTRPVVGTLYSEEFGAGRCEITGTLEAYFETNDLYQAVLAHGGGALSFTAGEVTNEKYTFLMPKVTFGNGVVQTGGNNDDVTVSIPFQAVYDATEACSIKITRAVA